jgi:hypothetical protein
MALAVCADQASIPPPSYHRSLARALHLDALTLVRRLQLLALCELAVQLAHQQCPPPLPAGRGGAPRTYREESLVLLALLRTLWRLSGATRLVARRADARAGLRTPAGVRWPATRAQQVAAVQAAAGGRCAGE